MPNNQNNLRWLPGQEGGRVPSPQRMVQPTGFEPLAALATSWLGKKQAEEKGLQGAFPALVAAGVLRPPKAGETATFNLGGIPWVAEAPMREYKPETEAEAIRLKKAGVAPKVPTWSQQQSVKSIKAGLKRGKVIIGKQWGEPTTYEVDSLDKALAAIGEAGLDPSLFEEDLEFYRTIVRTGKVGNRKVAELQNGDIVYMDTRKKVE